MRVALTSRFSPAFRGGIETVVRELAVHLERQQPTWEIDRVWAFDKKSLISSLPLLCDIVAGMLITQKSRRADVVLINGAEYAWLLALFAPRSTRVIIVWHGTRAFEVPALTAKMTFPVWVYWKIETWMQGLACIFDRHIAVAPSVVEELQAAYGFTKRVDVILNGAPSQADQSSGPNLSSRAVLWIGTNAYKKGLDIALAAHAMARTKLGDLELRVAGLTARDAGPGEHAGVSFLGPLTAAEIEREFAGAACLLATTRYEACSMAVVEAFAHGVPVIASPTVSWMLDGAGIAVPRSAGDDFAQSLVWFFSPSVDRGELAARARQRAADFDWKTAAERYCDAILAHAS